MEIANSEQYHEKSNASPGPRGRSAAGTPMTIPRALYFPAKWPGRAEEVTEAVKSDDKGPTPGNVVASCRPSLLQVPVAAPLQ
ncbi:hypothetical protein AbraIFM66951_010745 [Aspergillus brasiliensis]|uniref:Uncharacterized protein n=1 Tax=Aspergillus brasiliensis TaxID=319629 RepID=A0A9W6DHF0_9EURO|nr:hypothetical protein AbraCBS73388_008282 [Aspergillus brasiliensis]GKZ47383.1 hypothetical protein AbraIFM66951_010745 [Aspergillus brasiliensis]